MNFKFFSMPPKKKTNINLKATCTVDIDGDRTSILETMSLDPPINVLHLLSCQLAFCVKNKRHG